MPHLPNYLNTNQQIIHNIPNQAGFAWQTKYQGFRYDSDVFTFFKVMVAKGITVINRDTVLDIFDPKHGHSGRFKLIAAMIWGGIDTSVFGNHFARLLGINLTHLNKIITDVENWVSTGQIRQAVQALETTHHIDGLGHAFYTKWLHFLSFHNSTPIKPTPLIFDKHIKNAYCAMLYENKDPRHSIFFTPLRASNTNRPYVDVQVGQLSNTYLAFLDDMDCWANQLGVTSDKLEQFLFGWRINQKNPPYPSISQNPRFAIKDILRQRDNNSVYETINNTDNVANNSKWELLTDYNAKTVYFAPKDWLPWNVNNTANVRFKNRHLIFELYWLEKTGYWKISLVGSPNHQNWLLCGPWLNKIVPPKLGKADETKGYAVWREQKYDTLIGNRLPKVPTNPDNNFTNFLSINDFYKFLDEWVSLVNIQFGETGGFWRWIDYVSKTFLTVNNLVPILDKDETKTAIQAGHIDFPDNKILADWNTLPFGEPASCKEKLLVLITENYPVQQVIIHALYHVAYKCPETKLILFKVYIDEDSWDDVWQSFSPAFEHLKNAVDLQVLKI